MISYQSRPSGRADFSSRIDRYTEVSIPVQAAATFTHEPQSPSSLMRSSHPSPAKLARLSGSHSNTDMRNIDMQNVPQEDSRSGRSSSMILSRAVSNNTYWHDQSVEPRIFPGLVHEQTRRGSLKREGGSEYDSDVIAIGGLGGPRRGPEKVEKGLGKSFSGIPGMETSDGDTELMSTDSTL